MLAAACADYFLVESAGFHRNALFARKNQNHASFIELRHTGSAQQPVSSEIPAEAFLNMFAFILSPHLRPKIRTHGHILTELSPMSLSSVNADYSRDGEV